MDEKRIREALKDKQRIVLKIGSSSIIHEETGGADYRKLETLVRIICDLKNQGKDVILVSSGAIGDEMLTPDSSRFWPAEGYEPGHGQPSFDKQFARDWLKANEGHNWTLPQDIVDKTIDKYLQAYKLLTGKDL